MLACPGFLGARIERLLTGPGEAPGRRSRYRLESEAALQRYFERDAPRLRADAVRRFGDRVQFERRILLSSALPR